MGVSVSGRVGIGRWVGLAGEPSSVHTHLSRIDACHNTVEAVGIGSKHADPEGL